MAHRELRATLPAELRLEGGLARLEAAGRRAHAVQTADGALLVAVDGMRVRLDFEPALRDGVAEAWLFAALRARPGSAELLFAAADQPLVLFERELEAGVTMRFHRSGDERLAVRVNGTVHHADAFLASPDERGAIRVTVQPASIAAFDADALIGGAVARARRRAAQRPRIVRPGAGGNEVAALEHAIHLERAAASSIEVHAALLDTLALLALNDAAAAQDVARTIDGRLAHDAARALVTAGAWAAWRGLVVPLDGARSGARSVLAADTALGSDVLSRAAHALAPLGADLVGAQAGSNRAAMEPGAALAALAASTPELAAARVLQLMHGTLGVMPDAAKGRVRIAPSLEHGVTAWEQLAVGDAMIAFRANVSPDSARIELDQTSGGTPITAILEPWLPVGRLREALVEETPAQLDTTPEAEGIRVRIQLVIDRRRTLVLRFDGR